MRTNKIFQTPLRGFGSIIFITLLTLFVSFSARGAEKVELRVESSSRTGEIAVGQQFYIKIIVNNINDGVMAPKQVNGAKILYFGQQSTSSSITTINGQTTQRIVNVYALTLKAEKAGKFSFGPVTVGGVKSNTVQYTIVQAGASSDPSYPASQQGAAQDAGSNGKGQGEDQDAPTFIGKGNDQLFLRASVSKSTAYEQEALVYTVKLYTTYGSIKFIGATDAPKFDGFVIEESNNVSNQLAYETYQGKTYATAVIARYIIFPQMSGQLKIIGNKYTVSTDAEEYYHDPFFSTLTVRRPIQLNVTPNDLVVNVKALPTPRPANFSGGVGKFMISSTLPSADIAAHQAGSISYTVTGEGNLKYVNLPDLNAIFPDEIEVFSPVTDVKSVVGSSNVSGSVKFDYSFMPVEPGKYTIPAVELVYFNPATGKYETSASRSYTLNVTQGVESSKSQATLTYNSQLLPVNLKDAKEARPYIRGFLYWLIWYILPVILLAGLLIGMRKYTDMMADVSGMRSRRAGKMARKRLKKCETCIKRNDEDLFYDEMLKAIWGYLKDKLGIPLSDLNRENVSQLLADHYIDDKMITSVVNLLDECEFAKYSPASSRRKMQEVYDDATDVLNNLEQGFAESKKKIAESQKEEIKDEIIS